MELFLFGSDIGGPCFFLEIVIKEEQKRLQTSSLIYHLQSY